METEEHNSEIPSIRLPEIPTGLNPKQVEFLRHYVTNGFNATAAAISAGYSKKTARQQASRMLTNVNICSYLDQLSENAGIQIRAVLEEIKGIAFTDLVQVVDWDSDGRVRIRDPEEIPPAAHAALRKIKSRRSIRTEGKGENKAVIETIETEVEILDKQMALRELRRHFGGGADLPGEQLKAGEGVTVVIVQSKPFGFERQEPSEQANATEVIE